MTRLPDEPRVGVTGGPRLLLRLEGAALLAAASFIYARLGGEWGFFALLFFTPDISMLGYLAGPRIGAAHVTIVPISVGALGLVSASQLLMLVALIHLAHIGFDRALGYGLKHASAFGDTHLGRIGRGAADADTR